MFLPTLVYQKQVPYSKNPFSSACIAIPFDPIVYQPTTIGNIDFIEFSKEKHFALSYVIDYNV